MPVVSEPNAWIFWSQCWLSVPFCLQCAEGTGIFLVVLTAISFQYNVQVSHDGEIELGLQVL